MIKLVSLYSGSSGNCIFLSDGQTSILVDAGISGRRIEAALKDANERPENLNAIIVTHEHSDHASGIGVMARRYKTPLFATAGTWSALSGTLAKIAPEQINVITAGLSFNLGSMEIEPFTIPHDAAEPVAYSIYSENRKITIATDIGHMNLQLLKKLEGSHMLLLESNHDVNMLKMGRYPWPLKQRILGNNGHLCNDMAGKVVTHLARNGTRCILLGHLSQENNFPELAYQTSLNALAEQSFIPSEHFHLEVARRDCSSSIFWMDGDRIWSEPRLKRQT